MPTPVTPPASPMSSRSEASACSVRATFTPLPPGRVRTEVGRFTPAQFTVVT